MKEFNWLKFRGYLKSLSIEQNPFDCPHLKVLPEDVYVEGNKDEIYEKGSLICSRLIADQTKKEYSCSSPMILGNKGLEILCRLDEKTKFRIRI